MTIASSGYNVIDALAYTSWNAQAGTAAQVTYSFLNTVPPYASSIDANGFMPLDGAQRQAVRDCLALWSAVARIEFTEVAAAGKIRIGSNDQSADDSAGYSDLPYNGSPGAIVYTYFDSTYPQNHQFALGEFGRNVFLHELGHAIGLKHPGKYNMGDLPPVGPYLPAVQDSNDYSIMSYNDCISTDSSHLYAASPMMFDILAVQYLYGANLNYHAGNDTYAFADNSAPQCIWDGGGINTLDFSACTNDTLMSLYDGSFSSTKSDYYNVSIAWGVKMQNAIGGSGNDDIILAGLNGWVNAGAGDDVIEIGISNSSVDGGTGFDSLIMNGPQNAYVLNRGPGDGSAIVTGLGRTDIRYVISNMESLNFTDGKVYLRNIFNTTPPVVAHPLNDIYAGVGKGIYFSMQKGSFVDHDVDDGLSYSATLSDGSALPSWLKFSAATQTFSGTTANPGQLSVRVKAEDTGGHSVSSDFHLFTLLNYGQEFFASGQGGQTFSAGAALDQVFYTGKRADYSITMQGKNATVMNNLTGKSDLFTDVERIKFSDASVALDVGKGHGGVAYGLYQAAFNRTPDVGGLGFWINALDTGTAAIDVMKVFITSPEFISTYNKLDNSGFVNQIYQNVLHRPADAGGLAFWLNGINSGNVGRADVVNFFTQSDEFQGHLAVTIGNGFTYTPYFV